MIKYLHLSKKSFLKVKVEFQTDHSEIGGKRGIDGKIFTSYQKKVFKSHRKRSHAYFLAPTVTLALKMFEYSSSTIFKGMPQ